MEWRRNRTLAREIIRLRLEAEHLDTATLARHLRDRGYSELLIDIDRAAAKSGAPFYEPDVTLAAARSQWSYAFEVLNRLAALDLAADLAKREMAGGAGAAGFMDLKRERDALRRAVKSGTIWTPEGSS